MSTKSKGLRPGVSEKLKARYKDPSFYWWWRKRVTDANKKSRRNEAIASAMSKLIWINDGKELRRWPKEKQDRIPDGWERGMGIFYRGGRKECSTTAKPSQQQRGHGRRARKISQEKEELR